MLKVSTGASRARSLFPGVLLAALIALAAQFISDHYGAPAMLMALLFGIALNFLSDEKKVRSWHRLFRTNDPAVRRCFAGPADQF